MHVVSGLLGHASVKITADIYGARAKRNTGVAASYISCLAASSSSTPATAPAVTPVEAPAILSVVPALPPPVEDAPVLAASA